MGRRMGGWGRRRSAGGIINSEVFNMPYANKPRKRRVPQKVVGNREPRVWPGEVSAPRGTVPRDLVLSSNRETFWTQSSLLSGASQRDFLDPTLANLQSFSHVVQKMGGRKENGSTFS